MLRLDLRDYSDGYIVVKGTKDLGVHGNNDMKQKGVIFKNNAPFRSCIRKINNTFIHNAEYLDIIMPMYNLLQYFITVIYYSNNFSMISGSVPNYYTNKGDNVKDNASNGIRQK